jgi:hypothetical protein
MAAVIPSTKRDSLKIESAGVEAGAKIFVGLEKAVGFPKQMRDSQNKVSRACATACGLFVLGCAGRIPMQGIVSRLRSKLDFVADQTSWKLDLENSEQKPDTGRWMTYEPGLAVVGKHSVSSPGNRVEFRLPHTLFGL